MKSRHIVLTTLSLLASVSSFADTPTTTPDPTSNSNRMRVDCRFFGTSSSCPRFCYSSATYTVNGLQLSNIQYGVGCDYQTIYNDKGTPDPQDTTLDKLRPITSAIPQINLLFQYALRVEGTYKSRIDLSTGSLEGLCYVSNTDHQPYIGSDLNHNEILPLNQE
jgi:hypothetical protein